MILMMMSTFCCSMKGYGAVGMRVYIYWPEDGKYYRGIVYSFDVKSQKHQVVYDDGEKEEISLNSKKFFNHFRINCK